LNVTDPADFRCVAEVLEKMSQDKRENGKTATYMNTGYPFLTPNAVQLLNYRGVTVHSHLLDDTLRTTLFHPEHPLHLPSDSRLISAADKTLENVMANAGWRFMGGRGTLVDIDDAPLSF